MTKIVKEQTLSAEFRKVDDHYLLLLDYRKDSKLCGWGNQGSHLRPEVVDWLKANNIEYNISGGGTVNQTVLLILKGARDATLFRMFWM